MKSVSNNDLDIAYDGPAIATNKCFVSVAGPNIRLAFCEAQEPRIGPKFRTAVSMTIGDAISLADVIKEISAMAVVTVAPTDLDEKRREIN